MILKIFSLFLSSNRKYGMKRLFSILLFIWMTQWVVAIPVKKSGWKIIRLASGVEIRAMFKGDEHLHYMEDEDGQKYVFDEQLQAYPPADYKMER